MLFIQWLSNSAHLEQHLYADVDASTSDLPENSIHGYSHQITARRTETRLKKQQCDTPEPTLFVRCVRVTVSLYVALSREVAVMVAILVVHVIVNVSALY